MPNWLVSVLAVAIMILAMVLGARRTLGELPQGTSRRALRIWLASAIPAVVVLSSLAVWIIMRAESGTRYRLEVIALLLGYGVLFIAGLYVWKQQRQKKVLRRVLIIAVCSSVPIVGYFALSGKVSPVILGIVVGCLLLVSAVVLTLSATRPR